MEPLAVDLQETGNLTNTVLSLMDKLSPNRPWTPANAERLKKSLRLLFGFLVGCVAAAAAISLLGDWTWSLPAALAAMALACGSRGPAYPPNSADR